MFDRSNERDIEDILQWLNQIAPPQVRALHQSCSMIATGHRNGSLQVLRQGARVVSIALGGPGVIEMFGTHPQFRGRGFGGALAEHCIKRAADADIVAIELECVPETSLGFWLGLGFEEFAPRYGHNRWVMLRIAKQHDLPSGARIDVVIRTFDAQAHYGSRMTALNEYRRAAVLMKDQSIQLARRIVLHEPGLSRGSKLVVEIRLNGERLIADIANSARMERIGIRHDRFRQFFIDSINLQNAAGALIR